VQVVSQDQFRRGKEHEASAAVQVPLSDYLQEGSGTDVAATASKPAPWAAREDLPAASLAGPSLREIQEAEAKKAEAKRAAEKAAARARRTVSPSAADDLPTTLSWGLASAPAAKSMAVSSGVDSPAGTPATPWSAGKAPPKKTLMEIQEEERRRAEKAKAQQMAQAVALRKGYADSAGRSASATVAGSSAAIANSAGGGWSVVGAGGKPAAAAVRAALPTPRTASLGSVPASASPLVWNVGAKPGAASATPPSRPAPPSPAVAAKPRVADENAPSAEFLKYCKDNLQGLTIRTDEFIDMLLQFPLDAGADMIELIADTVYAYSSTLDGRRFAHDFVSKRKLDVQGRRIRPLASTPEPPRRPDTAFKLVKGKAAKHKRG
jgi:PERQ amino acid-rich with GYF domain-containing protein